MDDASEGSGATMTARHFPIIAALVLTFFLFAVLLNSVGPVILQSIISFAVPKTQAALLEGFKDLSIAGASFAVSLFLPMTGYRRGTALSLLAVAAACAAAPAIGTFHALQLQFAIVGMAFAIAKTSIYVIVGLVTSDRKAHASATSTLEGIFMAGVLSSFWLFGAFIDRRNPAALSWLNVYWWLAGAALLIAVLLAVAPLDERRASSDATRPADLLLAMPRLVPVPFVIAFLVSAFLDVLVEQSLGSWLPTFNREVLNLPPTLAVQLASFYAGSLAIGRLGAGLILRRVAWVWVLGTGLCLAVLLLGLVVPMTGSVSLASAATWRDLPVVAFAIPLVGLLLAPIYPVLCSAVLSGLPPSRHAAMTGLILISSALGGTLGSFITGRLFAALSGKIAFLAILPSMVALLVGVVAFHFILRRAPAP